MTSSSNCAANPCFSRYRYTGKERDTESGNDYFGARYYASSMGRFMSPDPSGLTYANPYNPQSLNLYAYVLNNPLKNIDPTGLDCVYLSDDAKSIEEVDADSDTSESDCAASGGTHVVGGLVGYGSTDPDGTLNEFFSNAYGTQYHDYPDFIANPSDPAGAIGYLADFLIGLGPTNVYYGPGNTATQQMQNTQNVQKTRSQYIQAGCPGTPSDPASLQQGHLAAYRDSLSNPGNTTQGEVGGYSGGIYTVNGTTTFTINNPSSLSSLDAESAINSSHHSDNPFGPTGPAHTVNQTFQWTETGLCNQQK
jgi:RHS repeat-associated protein